MRICGIFLLNIEVETQTAYILLYYTLKTVLCKALTENILE